MFYCFIFICSCCVPLFPGSLIPHRCHRLSQAVAAAVLPRHPWQLCPPTTSDCCRCVCACVCGSRLTRPSPPLGCWVWPEPLRGLPGFPRPVHSLVPMPSLLCVLCVSGSGGCGHHVCYGCPRGCPIVQRGGDGVLLPGQQSMEGLPVLHRQCRHLRHHSHHERECGEGARGAFLPTPSSSSASALCMAAGPVLECPLASPLQCMCPVPLLPLPSSPTG